MHKCVNCGGSIAVARMACEACGLGFEGRFNLPRLARLSAAEQDLGERLLLAGGNLKEVAGALEVSYPTLRKRLDDLIAALRRLRDEDEKRCQVYLDAVESGAMTPEEAARLIKELKGAA